jgi:RimJ/RimL family protein N-acetyltransferase
VTDDFSEASTNSDSPAGTAPRLDGGDFFLDGHCDGDASAMAAGDDPENVRWLNEGHVSGLEQNRSAIARWQENWRTGSSQRTWALREAVGGDLAGGCELRLEGSGIADFSYWIYPAYRGRGWAARALTMIMDLAFSEFGIARATVLIEPDNTASHRVAAAAGFAREGVLRSAFKFLGTRKDAVLYSRLPTDPAPR